MAKYIDNMDSQDIFKCFMRAIFFYKNKQTRRNHLAAHVLTENTRWRRCRYYTLYRYIHSLANLTFINQFTYKDNAPKKIKSYYLSSF